MSQNVELIAAINIGNSRSEYANPFIRKIFVSDNQCNIRETELCIEADFLDRNIAETYKMMLQLVAYTIVINPNSKKIFVAQRTGGEQRLLHAVGMAVADEDALVLHEQEPLGWLRGAVIAVARDLLKWNVREQLVQLFPVPPAIAEMEDHAGSGLVHGADHIGQIPVGIGEDQNFHSSSSFP